CRRSRRGHGGSARRRASRRRGGRSGRSGGSGTRRLTYRMSRPLNRISRNAAFLARVRMGGRRGNEQLTAAAAILLILLLAVEGATLLNLRALLSVHAFVGVLLVPIVALKLASVGWRMARYYLGGAEYVEAGPPHVAMRVLFGTGIALLALNQTQGILVGLHKASFVVWLGSTALHVLVHVWKLRPAL